MYHASKWRTASRYICKHINLKMGLLVLRLELRTASPMRERDGTEEGDSVGRETRVQSGCNPSHNVDFG